MIMSFVFTIATIVFFAWLIIVIPVIFVTIVFHYATGRQNHYQQNSVPTLVRKFYNPKKFKSTTDCAICIEEFNTDSEVTPLPCSVKHYFHT